MKRRDYTPRFVALTLLVIIGVVGLGFIPSIEIFGMELQRVDILAEIRSSESAMEYEADMERLEQELATVSLESVTEMADTLVPTPPQRYEWIVQSSTAPRRHKLHSSDIEQLRNECRVAIEEFDTSATTRFDRFIAKLAAGESVRIAFMGDSFIEGDILTSDLRHYLQHYLGGRGVGFVACDMPFNTVRKSIKRTSSSWHTYSIMKPKGAPEELRNSFFISGYLAEGTPGATTTWQTTSLFPTLDSVNRARLLLISRDDSRVELILNDSLRREFAIEGDDHLRELYVEGDIRKLGIHILEGKVLCYGASFEGKEGVTLDNFSVRSNNGHAIFGTSAAINRQADELLGYDLIVLQYGLNIMQKEKMHYAKYRDQLMNMIAYVERCFPEAAIVVLGVSDRWVKEAESASYEPIGSVHALTSYQRAAADSLDVAFWNTAQAMEILGDMPSFVARGWAAKDHTHITFAGGKRIAYSLATAIASPLYEALLKREAEEQHMKMMEEQRTLRNIATTHHIDSALRHVPVTIPTNNTEE